MHYDSNGQSHITLTLYLNFKVFQILDCDSCQQAWHEPDKLCRLTYSVCI